MEEGDRGPALAAASALEKNVAELTVMDVYDIAALVGHEFERVIDQHGCEAIARLMPKVVRVLEILEVLVSRHHVAPELDELRLELDRLRLERMDRIEKERKHRKVGSGLGAPLRAGGGGLGVGRARTCANDCGDPIGADATGRRARGGRPGPSRARPGPPVRCRPGDAGPCLGVRPESQSPFAVSWVGELRCVPGPLGASFPRISHVRR